MFVPVFVTENKLVICIVCLVAIVLVGLFIYFRCRRNGCPKQNIQEEASNSCLPVQENEVTCEQAEDTPFLPVFADPPVPEPVLQTPVEQIPVEKPLVEPEPEPICEQKDTPAVKAPQIRIPSVKHRPKYGYKPSQTCGTDTGRSCVFQTSKGLRLYPVNEYGMPMPHKNKRNK